MTERGEPPEGVWNTIYDPAKAETSVYFNGERIGTIPDHQLARMSRDGLSVDWAAWRDQTVPKGPA